MDYTKQDLKFKIKKVLRYVRLYGISRTLVKVRGQYHMRKRYDTLPPLRKKICEKKHIGIIGCGNFAFSNIAYYLYKNYGHVIRAAMDIDIHKAASLFEKYSLCYYTEDAAKIISDPAIDLIFIASNHSTHAEYAIKTLEHNKSVHIEKPHVVTEDQLIRLCQAILHSAGKVNLGFNRPLSLIGRRIKHSLDTQPGAAMFNWFIAGHEIAPEHWYFKTEEGGRILGNLCHWSDFVYNMMPQEDRYPLTIIPGRSEKSDCDIAVTYIFGNGSIAALTFSAKGHTFEGVREHFAAHKGNVLISMDDFKTLIIENVDKKDRLSLLFRDYGHQANIKRSYELTRSDQNASLDCSVKYVWETGELFLKTKKALEDNVGIVLQQYDEAKLLK